MHIRIRASLAFALLLPTACSSYSGLSDDHPAVSVTQKLPAPDVVSIQPQNRPYLVGPYDSIAIEVYGAPELNRQGMVDAAGNFSMPIASELHVSGLTTGQIAGLVRSRLAGRYIRDPQVSVQLTEARSQQITVDGAVEQPGVYPILGRTTLQRVIALAHGTTDFAKLDKVVVFREVGGQRMAAVFSLKDIREGTSPDPEVYGNDTVVVGDNAARRVFRDTIQTLPALGAFAVLR